MFHFFRVGNQAAGNQLLAATTGNPWLIGVSFHLAEHKQ